MASSRRSVAWYIQCLPARALATRSILLFTPNGLPQRMQANGSSCLSTCAVMVGAWTALPHRFDVERHRVFARADQDIARAIRHQVIPQVCGAASIRLCQTGAWPEGLSRHSYIFSKQKSWVREVACRST